MNVSSAGSSASATTHLSEALSVQIKPDGASSPSSLVRPSSDAVSTDLPSAYGPLPENSPLPKWFSAVRALMDPETANADAHVRVERFSRQIGCLRAAADFADQPATGGSGGEQVDWPHRLKDGLISRSGHSRDFRLADVYRYWGDPLVSSALTQKKPLPDKLPCGADGHRLGGVAVSISESFHAAQARAMSACPRPDLVRTAAARLYSRFGGFSPAGHWHGMLAELAQDLYLKNLLEVLPRQESVQTTSSATCWPTLSGPSLLTVEHGLGVPLLRINWTNSAIGFSDFCDESLINLEGRLFSNWLLMQCRNNENGWSDAQLNDVLTPALGQWVSRMRESGLIKGGAALWPAWFKAVAEHSPMQGRYKPFEGSQAAGAELDLINVMTDEAMSESSLVDWFEKCPSICHLAEGLVALQDAVLHGGGSLPAGGAERAYLCALVRNMTCGALGLHEPAEIAQFDLLLHACRKYRNDGFTDTQARHELEQHHLWVAQSQSGNRSGQRRALLQLTSAYRDAADAREHECIFTLDEPCRAPARFQNTYAAPARVLS